MRLDWGIYTGCIAGAYSNVHKIGDLTKFDWWQIVLICVYATWGTVIYGVVGALFQESIKHFTAKWNGKTKVRKLFMSGL